MYCPLLTINDLYWTAISVFVCCDKYEEVQQNTLPRFQPLLRFNKFNECLQMCGADSQGICLDRCDTFPVWVWPKS